MAALIDPVYSKTLLVISVVSIYLHSCEWCSHCEEENTFDKTRLTLSVRVHNPGF